MNPDSPSPNNLDPIKQSSNRTKIIAIVVVAAICVIALTVLAFSRSKSKTNSQSSTSSNSSGNSKATPTPLPDSNPPKEAIDVTTKYVQARENSVGADQATPTSWIDTVKPISTAPWFAQLQPAQASTAGNASGEFSLAHDNHYVVTATLTKCIWNFKIAFPTPTSGAIYCELSDTTNDLSSKAAIPADSLPFGWTRNGSQTPVNLTLLKQNGVWMVSDDGSSNEPD